MSLKVLMVTPWYPDRLSAHSGVFIRNQARILAEENKVVVISSKVDYSRFSWSHYEVEVSTSDNITEHRLYINKSLPVINQLHHLGCTLWYSLKIARQFKPDIIHASIGYPGAIWGWMLSMLIRKPYVITEHTRIRNNFRSAFHKFLTAWGLKRAHRVLAVSNFLRRELEDVLQKRVQVVPNVVDTETFNSVPMVAKGVPQIGFLGGMNTDVKGLDVLLTALASINGNYVLHIGGSGSLESTYKSMAQTLGIADKCHFYGFIPYEQVPSFMGQLHFFVCSSRYETFCVALAEALSAGRPVISTRCGGPEDFVNDDNGLLVPIVDSESLSQAIEKMMATYHNYDNSHIRSEMDTRFSAKVFLRTINKIYEDVLQEYRR